MIGHRTRRRCVQKRGATGGRRCLRPTYRLGDSLWTDPGDVCAAAGHGPSITDEELVRQARDGCGVAIEALLGKYRGLVEGKARTFFLAGAERDDVIQEGMIGLFKAIRDFLAEKNVAFRTFAETCVTRQIITATKMASRQKHRLLNTSISLDAGPDDGSSSDAGDVPATPGGSADPEQALIGKQAAWEISEGMRGSLSELECLALAAYLQGRTYHEIADTMDMDPKQIDNALQRAKRKMKSMLAQAPEGS